MLDPELSGLTKDDFVAVCGDLEMIDVDDASRAANIAKLEALPYTTLFIDGNHEEYEALERYPVEEWHGGKVRRISDSVLFLMRGQVFEVEGKTFFAMGGAPTFHKARLLGLIEGPDPGMPSEAEKAVAKANLANHGWRVDFVLTHTAPTGIVTQIPERRHVFASELNTWLEDLEKEISFSRWLFGHYHCDHEIDGRFRCLFNMIYRAHDGALFRDPKRDDSVQGRYKAVSARIDGAL